MQRVLVIISNSEDTAKAARVSRLLCKDFIDLCQQKGLLVDVIDLEKEHDYNPMQSEQDNDTKVLEFQLRIKKADIIAVFHPVYHHTIPGKLKVFLDDVFTSGFAYLKKRGIFEGQMDNLPLYVFPCSEEKSWQIKWLYNNSCYTFWKRSIADICNLQLKYALVDDVRRMDNTEEEHWHVFFDRIITPIASKNTFATGAYGV